MNRVSKSILQDLRCTAKRHYSKSRRPPSKPSFAASAISATLGVGTGTGIIYFLWPEALQSTPTSARAPLSPSRFTASTVVSNVDCGPQTKLLQVVVPPHLIPDVKSKSSFSPIWSVFIKDDDIQVERPYTPLEGIDKDGKMLFWIKKYPKGEVGRWLHSKTSNDKIELRGPLTTWAWKDDVWDEVIMISGGTGITPFCQLFHTVISRQLQTKTRFTLLHSSLTPADLPPPKILDRLAAFAAQHPDKLQLKLFIDSEGTSPASQSLPNLRIGRIGQSAIEESLGLNIRTSWWASNPEIVKPPSKKVMFLVCGPDPMINAISGPFGRNLSQGPVKGVLGEMGFASDQVWKL